MPLGIRGERSGGSADAGFGTRRRRDLASGGQRKYGDAVIRHGALLLAIFALAASACEAADAQGEAAASAEAIVVDDPTDPLAHLKVISAPEMEGRGTPSAGLDRATDYVVGECVRLGLGSGVGEGSFKQPFAIGGGRAHNVLALYPGAGRRRDQVILMAAHLDHLGIGYPGADDNGSGSAALLAIANRLVSDGATPDRTLAFLWTAGEERGLVGSSWFVDHPPAGLPLERIVQVINLDALGALEEWRFSILPDGAANTARTAAIMADVGRGMDPPFTTINEDLQEYTTRQDGRSFVRKRIPTIWAFEGLQNPEGGGPLMRRYHRSTDTFENMLAENGGRKLRRMTTMLATTLTKLASADLPSVD